MNYGNCKYCGKAFGYEKIRVCEDCLKKLFIQVREYIYANGRKTPAELTQATGVPLAIIEYFVEEGGLYEDEHQETPEEEREKKARLQKLQMLNELKNSIEADAKNKKPESSLGNGMLFANRDRRR